MKRIILWVVLFGLALCGPRANARSLLDLLTEFRGTVGEVDSLNSTFNNPLATQWLNSGQDYVTTLFGPLQRDTVYAITADEAQFRFTLPIDFQSVFSVVRIDNTGDLSSALAPIPPDSFGLARENKGGFYTFGETILIDGFYLLVDDTILVQFYANVPAMVALTDTTAIDQQLQPFIIDYAISRYEWAKQFFGEGLQVRALLKSDMADSRASRVNLRETE